MACGVETYIIGMEERIQNIVSSSNGSSKAAMASDGTNNIVLTAAAAFLPADTFPPFVQWQNHLR